MQEVFIVDIVRSGVPEGGHVFAEVNSLFVAMEFATKATTCLVDPAS